MKPTLCEVIAVVISVAVIVQSAPAENKEVRLVRQLNMRYPNGDYGYSTFLDNGSNTEQKGTLTEVDGVQFYRVKGYYAYSDPSGEIHFISYVADENGYRVIKEPVIPTGPQHISPKAIASVLG